MCFMDIYKVHTMDKQFYDNIDIQSAFKTEGFKVEILEYKEPREVVTPQ